MGQNGMERGKKTIPLYFKKETHSNSAGIVHQKVPTFQPCCKFPFAESSNISELDALNERCDFRENLLAVLFLMQRDKILQFPYPLPLRIGSDILYLHKI